MTSEENGVAIYILRKEEFSLSVDCCLFTNLHLRREEGMGGVMYCNGSESAIITSSLLFECSSSGWGGGIYLISLSLCCLVHNSSFEKCEAKTQSTGGLLIASFSITDSSCIPHSSFGSLFFLLYLNNVNHWMEK
jgi:hypothetical protein